ncbi:rhamnan synthesis F family protein [Caldimonas caldifontis]|nr:rhamnan synthesis F family protein [Caldimonas caldifontis]
MPSRPTPQRQPFEGHNPYVLDEASGVMRRADAPPFRYNDGDAVEMAIHGIISSSSDVSCGSDDLVRQITDWPTLYHLSAARANLLRPIEHLLRGKRVLELGSGCGAISRYLGELDCELTCVEGSPRRASITALRCRDLPNVAVFNDNFQDFQPDQRYDVVTLIGVLEYSRAFLTGKDPVATALDLARSFLKEDGILLVAIENKLGLKYLAGAPEDHLGLPFYGVHGLYGDRTPVTFGRRELEALMQAAGFARTDFYYPYPDYKLPSLVLTEQALGQPAAVLRNLVSTCHAPDQAQPYIRTFSENAALLALADNRLLGELANSFLVVAAARSAPRTGGDRDLAFVYSDGRRKAYRKEVALQAGENGVVVRRRLLHAGPTPEGMRFPEEEPLVEGESLFNGLLSVVNRAGWCIADLVAWYRPLMSALQSAAHGPCVPPDHLDATPFNFLIDAEGRGRLIDLEWVDGAGVPLERVVFRGFYHSLTRVGCVAAPRGDVPADIAEISARATSELLNSPCDLQALLDAEAMLQKSVTVFQPQPQDFRTPLRVRGQMPHPAAAAQLDPPRPKRLVDLEQIAPSQRRQGMPRLAVVLHLFYPEYWADFAQALAELPEGTDLYITTPADKLLLASKLVQADFPQARIRACENRGRDVAPLIELLRTEPLDRYDYVLKLHTKRSPHLSPGQGERWRRSLLQSLVPSRRVADLLEHLERHPQVGLAAPAQWLVSLRNTAGYAKNLPTLKLWAARLGFEVEAGDYAFAAGTMFWMRGCVLAELRRLDIQAADFEPEAGQLDGTLAHALERLMPLLAFKCGLDVAPLPADLSSPSEEPGAKTLEEWLGSRRFTPSQEDQIRERLESQEGGPRLAVIVQATDGSRERLVDTLNSLEHARRLGLRTTVTVIIPPGLDAQALPGTPRLTSAMPGETVAAFNRAAADCDADWIMLARSGEVFTPNGLTVLALDLIGAQGCRAVYADELYRGADGALGAAFRPDFNLDLLLSFPAAMAAHWWFQRDHFLALGGLDAQFGDAAEFDLLLRLVEHGGLAGLGHVAEPLLIADTPSAADQAGERAALQRHLQARGYAQARVHQDLPRQYRIEYGHAAQPLVSIIIPTRDQLPLLQRCVESLLEKTAYPNYELLIVDNQSETEEARQWLDGVAGMGDERVRVLRYPHPFNFSAMNNLAVEQARGDYLVLLNNDTAIIEPGWLDALLNHAQRPEVGAVGAKLLHPDGTVQHAGVVLGLRGPAEHPFLGEAMDAHGTMQRLRVDQNYSALTAACLMVRKSLYQEVGGLDEGDFKVSYNDVDLCLKLAAAGYLNVWTPHALVMHEGSASQKLVDAGDLDSRKERFAAEKDALYAKWLPQIARDPAYNPNLSLRGKGFEYEARSDLVWHPLAWRPAPVVLAHMADRWGCGHYRVIQPFEALCEAGQIEGLLTDAALLPSELARLDPDVIVLQRQIGEQRLEAMRRMKAYSRAFKVYELDDYLPNLPLKSAYRQGIPKDALKSLRKGLGYVDRFVVSTNALAEAFEGLHPDIRIVKNRLPAAWWSGFTPQRLRGRKPRVGWAGSAGHAGDLALIIDVVKALAEEVEWVFFGLCPAEILPFVHEVHAGVPIDKYPAKLASLDLDLALAPLEQNLFNECKSNLRLIEYGVCGYPVVCSDIRCYQEDGLPVTRVKNRFKEWVDAIRMHTQDLNAAARAGDALREQVRAHWMLEGAALDAWRAAWTQP